MAHKKTKQPITAAPKRAGHVRHARKTGWLRKAVAQTFTSMLAPLLVGVALQCLQGHRTSSAQSPPKSVVVVPFAAPNASRSAVGFDAPYPERRDLGRFPANGQVTVNASEAKSY